MGRFKKGFFLGSLLGIGLTLLNTTKKGKKVREEMLDHAAVLYSDLRQKFLKSKTWNKMKKGDYVREVKKNVEKYAKKHKLPKPVKNMIIKVLSSQWPHMLKDLKLSKKRKK